MQNQSPLQTYYADRAKEYDSIYEKSERQRDLRILESWVPEILTGKRVFEVACGTGYWTQFYAPRTPKTVATDTAQETLDIAQTRPNVKNVTFKRADAYALPGDLGAFDAAFAGFWISHVPKQRLREFLTGLHKILLPTSTILFLDNKYVEGNSTPIASRDSEGNAYQTRKLRDGSVHSILKNFPSSEELTQAIEGIGTNAQFREFEYYWAFVYKTAP